MNSEKKISWKIPIIALCFLVGVAAWLGFGERGLVHLYRKEIERQACLDRIRQLAEANQRLLDEVQRLRTDMKYVESVARKQLNLVRENEVIYRFSKDDGSVKSPNLDGFVKSSRSRLANPEE